VSNLSVIDWIDERYENSKRIARQKSGEERQGWLEDASYLLRTREALKQLSEASADEHQNVPLRMHIALKILRAWNHGTAGYCLLTVHGINEWIDGGMRGPVPWPTSPFFAEWAQENGYSKVGDYVGFRCLAELTQEPK
jgi:hypothetical protein